MIDLRGKRVFVVEDNLENRIITRLALVKTGVSLEFDIWGRETLKNLNKFAPVDLIIMDLMLPGGMTGYQIFDEIRDIPDFARVPVVAVSASDATAIVKCRDRGFSGYIAKPIDDDLFPEQIARLINHEQVWHVG
jgi:CheY-like chemotaxis protein